MWIYYDPHGVALRAHDLRSHEVQAAQPDGGLVDNRSLDMFRILNLTKYCYLFLTVIYLVLLNHLL